MPVTTTDTRQTGLNVPAAVEDSNVTAWKADPPAALPGTRGCSVLPSC